MIYFFFIYLNFLNDIFDNKIMVMMIVHHAVKLLIDIKVLIMAIINANDNGNM